MKTFTEAQIRHFFPFSLLSTFLLPPLSLSLLPSLSLFLSVVFEALPHLIQHPVVKFVLHRLHHWLQKTISYNNLPTSVLFLRVPFGNSLPELSLFPWKKSDSTQCNHELRSLKAQPK